MIDKSRINCALFRISLYHKSYKGNKMLTSARNTIYGKISSIQEGAVNTEVALSFGKEKIIAIITNGSAKTMNIKVGESAYALIKSSSILLAKAKPERISARNILKVIVSEVNIGAINAEIIMGSGDNIITAQITNESREKLMIKEGDEAYAIFKASNIILGML